jgi:hypothetical protein
VQCSVHAQAKLRKDVSNYKRKGESRLARDPLHSAVARKASLYLRNSKDNHPTLRQQGELADFVDRDIDTLRQHRITTAEEFFGIKMRRVWDPGSESHM